MPVQSRIAEVLKQLDTLEHSAVDSNELMRGIVRILQSRMLKYNWVGFYLLEASRDSLPILVLGPFEGAMTPHTRIPLNQGICGAAASTGKTVVVDDVSKDPRYLACSLETKSEIVVPVFANSKVVGELDIDSHFPAAFGPDDRDLVEHCAALVSKRIEKEKKTKAGI